ncbi:MAG: lytic transglycosylase domain-containing protein, partial [bacterium]
NPDACSPSGATGLFQFMPATARRFGLRIWPFDERRNPLKSARAAAQYLKVLHRQFGSWPLCLAAYNAGEGAVGRLLKGAGKRSFEAIADQLPIETQMYVPKVLAVVALRENVDALRLPGPTADDSRWPPPLAAPLWAALRIAPPPFVVCRMGE